MYTFLLLIKGIFSQNITVYMIWIREINKLCSNKKHTRFNI